MKMAEFTATCPFEIGDKVRIGLTTIKTITDIAAIHYVKRNKVEFLYELDGNNQFVIIRTLAQCFDCDVYTEKEQSDETDKKDNSRNT